jgi:hypothetical protein
MIGKNPDAATSCRVRYSFMSARVSQSRSCEDLFTTDKIILASAQQIFLHLRCLVREHKFSKLGWHFKGIRRALSSLTFADAKYLRPSPLRPSPLHLHNPRYHDGCCQSNRLATRNARVRRLRRQLVSDSIHRDGQDSIFSYPSFSKLRRKCPRKRICE